LELQNEPAEIGVLGEVADVFLHEIGIDPDGLAGARKIVAAGGHVFAQDEATSVVWGMPGQVTNAGLCSAVLPLPEIAGKLTRLFTGERL